MQQKCPGYSTLEYSRTSPESGRISGFAIARNRARVPRKDVKRSAGVKRFRGGESLAGAFELFHPRRSRVNIRVRAMEGSSRAGAADGWAGSIRGARMIGETGQGERRLIGNPLRRMDILSGTRHCIMQEDRAHARLMHGRGDREIREWRSGYMTVLLTDAAQGTSRRD